MYVVEVEVLVFFDVLVGVFEIFRFECQFDFVLSGNLV